MKKVIPEKTEYFCNRCKKEIDHTNKDCEGKVCFHGRDYQGHAVGGFTVEFELCNSCTPLLRSFLNGEQTTELGD